MTLPAEIYNEQTVHNFIGKLKRWKYWRYMFLASAVIYYFSLPEVLFKDPYSTLLEDKEGSLLSATVAQDGQWRFPEADSTSYKFATSLMAFEDQRFHYHFGVDPISLVRALKQNVQEGKVVSGGSTLTMQVIRLMRRNKPRTMWEKCIEGILATRLEFRLSKDEIINLYASHAPFGGNVVGIEAACWRYFERGASNLSWGEAAMLAVLPNAPALIHPGRNRQQLKDKRDRLLDRLYATGKIDSLTCALSKVESIPEEPKALPRYAKHLLFRAAAEGFSQQRVHSTLDQAIQIRLEKTIEEHHERLRVNQIHNAAALVIEVETGNVLAYVGNTNKIRGKDYHGNQVDVINAPRSTGSILKPFLYAAMLDEGKILPGTILPDVPMIVAGFAPKNFSKDYDGAVHANQALIRSLNIPAVHLLREYRYEKFHSLLKRMGMSTLTRGPDHYGLSLILGGAEGSLWDISGMYASMARTLNHFDDHPGKNRYNKFDYHNLTYTEKDFKGENLEENSWLSAASIYQTFTALKELYRPDEESGWRHFSSSRKIAWKTGTSFGFRDGWAIGVTPEYVVGIWVGNADGEGRPGLTGVTAAAPILFDVFSQLPETSWFKRPSMEMQKIRVCPLSGMRKGEHCPVSDTTWVNLAGLQSAPCPYHKSIHLSMDGKFRVHSECEALSRIKTANWFILPPVQEFYFKSKNISYQSLPPFRMDCVPLQSVKSMDLIYPKRNTKVFIPRELDGQLGNVVFELAHSNSEATVFWHIDDEFVGATTHSHHVTLQPATGHHILTIVDGTGETIQQSFEVVTGR